jgi:transposase-like protein
MLIDVDTVTLKFRLYVTRNKQAAHRDDFKAGELRMEEQFKTSDSLMKYTHAMRLAANLSHVQLSSETREVVDGNG